MTRKVFLEGLKKRLRAMTEGGKLDAKKLENFREPPFGGDEGDKSSYVDNHRCVVEQVNIITSLSKLASKALERMEDGKYGFCLECEEPLSEKRLKAAPEAEYCVSCGERRENSGSTRGFETRARFERREVLEVEE